MSDQLREAIEKAWDRCLIREQKREPEMVAVFEAARKWLAVEEAEPSDLIAAVRRGVESGTIKGKVMCARNKAQADRMGQVEPGIYIVIGPVSDGGSKRRRDPQALSR